MHSTVTPTATTTTSCPFAERFSRPLPRDFAQEAEGLSWRQLVETYAPSTNHFHLADFSRRSLGRGRWQFNATISRPAGSPSGSSHTAAFRTHRVSTEATGEISAMSEMLAQLGAHLDTERFHQYSSDGTWCTIVRASSGRHSLWAMGFGQSSSDSGAAALLSAATRLYQH